MRGQKDQPKLKLIKYLQELEWKSEWINLLFSVEFSTNLARKKLVNPHFTCVQRVV